MTTDDPFVCPECSERAEYSGRVGLPPKVIYRCTNCGHENWISYRPDTPLPLQKPAEKKSSSE